MVKLYLLITVRLVTTVQTFLLWGRSTKEDRTAAQISQAIATVSAMSSQSLRVLSGVQLDAIAAYLKTPVPGAIACKTDFKPERAPVRLLAHGEYDNIAVDIFIYTEEEFNDWKDEFSSIPYIVATEGVELNFV